MSGSGSGTKSNSALSVRTLYVGKAGADDVSSLQATQPPKKLNPRILSYPNLIANVRPPAL